jgi:hypothetical protein
VCPCERFASQPLGWAVRLTGFRSKCRAGTLHVFIINPVFAMFTRKTF